MVKATFFESPIGYLHRCVFAGLDTNDRPQWLMVDQRVFTSVCIRWS